MKDKDARNEPVSNEPARKERLPQAGKKVRGPVRRWLRRITFAAGITVLIAFLLNIVLLLVLPTILEKEAAQYGLRCTYDRLSFFLFTSDLELWHLEVGPLDREETYMDLEYCRADVVVHALFTGDLEVWRVEVDGMDLWIDRDADGSFPLARHLEMGAVEDAPHDEESSEKKTDASETSDPGKQQEPEERIDLSLPFELDALRLQNVYAHIRDMTQTPPLETRFEANLRVSHVGTDDRPLRFELQLSSLPVLDAVRIEGQARLSADFLSASVDLAVSGFHPKALKGYLVPLGLEPLAETLAFRAGAEVHVKVNSDRPDTLSLTAETRDIQLCVDGAEALALDHFALEAAHLNPEWADLSSVVVEGIRCRAHRDASQTVCAAGFAFHPARPSEEMEAAAPEEPGPESRNEFVWTPPSLVIRDIKASFLDQATAPAAELGFTLHELTVQPRINSSRAQSPCLEIKGLISLPGVADAIHIQGEAEPFSARKSLDLQCSATGIAPRALVPYLKGSGLEMLLQNGSFTCTVHAVADQSEEDHLAAELELKEIVFSDTDPLLSLDSVSVSGVDMNTRSNRIDVESVEISGTRCAVHFDENRTIRTCGVALRDQPAVPDGERTLARPSTLEASANAQAADDKAHAISSSSVIVKESAPAPSIHIRKIRWSDNQVAFSDASMTPLIQMEIKEIGFEADNLIFDPNAQDLFPEPATLRAWFNAPGLIEALTLNGSLSSECQTLSIDLDVAGEGITAKDAAPYLAAMGCTPTLKEGTLCMHLNGSLLFDAGSMNASMALTDFRFSDQDTEWVGLDALRLDALQLQPGETRVRSIEITHPRARARRHANGGMEVAGFLFEPKPIAPLPDPAGAQQALPLDPSAPRAESGEISAPRSKESGAEDPGLAQGESAALLVLDQLRLSRAELLWSDLSVQPHVDTAIQLDLGLDSLMIGPDAKPASLQATLCVPGALDQLVLSGSFQMAPDAADAVFELQARGMRAGPLASYIPAPLKLSLEDGSFQATLHAYLSSHASGGQTAGLKVTDVAFREGTEGPAWVCWDDLQARLSRWDPEEQLIDVEAVTLTGFEAHVRKNAQGDLSLLGMTLPAPDHESKDAGLVAHAPAAEPTINPDQINTIPARPAPRPLRQWGENPPLVLLETLDLQMALIAELEEPEGEAPAEIRTSLRLRNLEPIRVLGREPEACPPVKLELSTTLSPGLESFLVSTELNPFAPEPHLLVDLHARGIQAQPLIDYIPGLSEQIDGRALEAGTFDGRIEARLNAKRRSPLDFDLSKGFGLELELKDLEFKDQPNGKVLAGLQELVLDVARISPDTGDVHVRSLEIGKPVAHITREDDGMHLLGLVLKAPEAPEPDAAATDDSSAGTQAHGNEEPQKQEVAATDVASDATVFVEVSTTEPVLATETTPLKKPAEFKVDRIYMTDIDVTFQDHIVSPAMIVPLNQLDVEVRDFTSLALVEPHPVRFSVQLGSGKVPLPKRVRSGGILSALGGTLTDLAGMGGEQEIQERPLFDEISVSGRMALKPVLNGWVRANVSALELGNFKGVVKDSGITLNDGLFDADVALRFRKEGSLSTQAKFSMTSLDLSETENGLISTYLNLPAPLDTVVFLLRDEDEIVSIPLDLEVGADGMSAARIAGMAVSTLGSLITDAVASSPFRVVGGTFSTLGDLGSLVPMGGAEEEALEEGPYLSLRFEPGDTCLRQESRQSLEALADRLDDEEGLTVMLRHELSEKDIEVAARNANPSPEDCLDLSRRFRLEKKRMAMDRAQLASRATAAFAAGLDRDGALLTTQIRSLDRQAGQLEKSLDETLALLQSGAERRASRRTRIACVDLGMARLEKVRHFLEACGTDQAAQRIK
ncbi:MAG: DUF748 domain-containing protein, partial [Planctomycetota bacterium]